MFGSIRYEQAVYGNFPFWNRGYAVLSRSDGCLPGWLEAMRSACQKFGERPAGVESFRSHFAVPTGGERSWMVVQADSLGCDDQGRPGATAFHAVFVTPWSYRRAGADPLAFSPAFRADWTLDDHQRPLPQGSFRPASRRNAPSEVDPRVGPIVEALARGRRAIVQSAEPAEALVRSVWSRLPGRTRRRTSVATWAFGDANRFDFLASPRIAGLSLDGSELVFPLDPP